MKKHFVKPQGKSGKFEAQRCSPVAQSDILFSEKKKSLKTQMPDCKRQTDQNRAYDLMISDLNFLSFIFCNFKGLW